MLTIIFEVTFNVHEILWSSQLFVYKTDFFHIDSTEILYIPKHLSSIARHFIPSTFSCGSAVCLFISKNINTNRVTEKVFDRIDSIVFHAY